MTCYAPSTPRAAILLLVVLLQACGSSGLGEKDANVVDTDGPAIDGSTNAAFVDVYTQVLMNLDYGCIFPCHDISGRGGMVLYSGNDRPEPNDVNLKTAYDGLVNVAAAGSEAPACLGETRVVPSRPEESLLYLKVTLDAESLCGSPMPLGARPPVSASHAELIRRWIENGAPPP